MAVHNSKDIPQTPTGQKKVEEKNLPPKVPRPPVPPGQNQQGINYKLPPRPGSRQQPSIPNSSRNNNQSYDYYNKEKRSSSRERSYERLNTDRDKSK